MKLLPRPDYFRDNIALRNDTFLGACHGLGEDLGINPDFIRVPLAAGIIVAPFLMVGIYLSMCVLVFVSRTFLPSKARQAAAAAPVQEEPVADNETVELPRAA